MRRYRLPLAVLLSFALHVLQILAAKDHHRFRGRDGAAAQSQSVPQPQSPKTVSRRIVVHTPSRTKFASWSDEMRAQAIQAAQHVMRSIVDEDLAIEFGVDTRTSPANRNIGTVANVNLTAFPYSAMGKLFFQDKSDHFLACTAGYVHHEYLVLTAGSCVYDVNLKSWNKNFLFYQRFNTGRGVMRMVKAVVLFSDYYSTGRENYFYDYALLVMSNPSTGSYISLGDPTNFDAWNTVAYSNTYDSGRYLQEFRAVKGNVTEDLVEAAHSPLAGAGGLWIVPRLNYAVGVSSFTYRNRPGVYSARFKPADINALLGVALEFMESYVKVRSPITSSGQ